MDTPNTCELCHEPEFCQRCMPMPRNDGEPAVWVVLKESDARNIVAATEKGEAYRAIEILKKQPWWPEICAGVRGLPSQTQPLRLQLTRTGRPIYKNEV